MPAFFIVSDQKVRKPAAGVPDLLTPYRDTAARFTCR